MKLTGSPRQLIAIPAIMVSALLCLTFASVFFNPTRGENQPAPDLLGPDNWPTTIDGAVRDLILRLPESEKARIRQTNEEKLILLHFDIGLLIRNRYGLWRGNDRLIISACQFRCHPDDASLKIIEALRHALQN